MRYLVKTPWWLKKLYPTLVWDIPATEKVLYLTFDDGPHPTATPFVLNQLNLYNAKATFFCIGNNVVKYPHIYAQLLQQGHGVGNHTHDHINGWKTSAANYVNNVAVAAQHINTNIFRPPYGRITKLQAQMLQQQANGQFGVIMWNVLSGDFDVAISPEQCLKNVRKNAQPGSIIVFHDSEKAYERMGYALPRVLDYYANQGYVFRSITLKKEGQGGNPSPFLIRTL